MKRKQIFIGGTGRSGTTILYDILGRHPEIYGLKDEMRFIIDYNGMINLVESLTTNYSPAQGGKAIYELENFLLNDLTNKETSPYPWYSIQDYLGKELYFEKVQNFLNQLMLGKFKGQATWLKDAGYEGLPKFRRRVNNKLSVFSEKSLKINAIPIPKYFENKETLTELISAFINDLFTSAAKANGKNIWCEKTPYNILHYTFIRQLFPDALFIHIKRDPRSVAQSYFRQTWAPNNTKDCALLLKNVYRKWLDDKSSIDTSSSNFIEVKLEDFAVNPREVLLNKIQSYFNLTNDFTVPEDLSLSKVNRAKSLLSKEELDTINAELSDEIKMLGYEV